MPYIHIATIIKVVAISVAVKVAVKIAVFGHVPYRRDDAMMIAVMVVPLTGAVEDISISVKIVE